MLDAALALLQERSLDDFTLQDIATRGRVSIGSIYHRFASKSELIRAAHLRTMERMRTEELLLMKRLARHRSLPELIPVLIEEIAELVRRHARALAPQMIVARDDTVMRAAGLNGYQRFAAEVHGVLLLHLKEIRPADPRRAVEAVFRVVWAALSRHLGLNVPRRPFDPGAWQIEKQDLADMCLAYLTSRSTQRR